MIFFKKQHEEIAIGFLRRIELMLRNENKGVLGYSIDDGVETLKLSVGQSVLELKIESAMYVGDRPEVKAPNPNEIANQEIEKTKEIVY